MFNAETIQKLQDDAVAIAINNEAGNEELPILAIPQGMKLESVEHLMPAPQRFKGQFKTGQIEEFVKYGNSNGNASVFVNQDDMSAKAYFDFGSPSMPEHRDHTAELTLKRTPEFKKLIAIDGDTLSQRDLVEMLEDYHANIITLGKEAVPGDEAPVIDLVSAIKAVRNTKVKTEAESETKIEDLSESQSTFAQMEVKNSAGHLPAYIDWKCTPSTGLKLPLQAQGQGDDENEERTFRVRVSAITNGDRVVFKLRIIQLEEHKQIVSQAFKDQLESDLNEDFQVRIGTWR